MTELAGKDIRPGGRLPVLPITVPVEILTMLAFSAALFAVVVAGSSIVSSMNLSSSWLVGAAYGGPAAVAFAIYWLIARRL